MDAFNDIAADAKPWLKTAMMLSMQTTHAVLEVSRIKYKDIEWFDAPLNDGGYRVYGILRIHRQKVKNKEASRVEIPVTKALKTIIDESGIAKY